MTSYCYKLVSMCAQWSRQFITIELKWTTLVTYSFKSKHPKTGLVRFSNGPYGSGFRLVWFSDGLPFENRTNGSGFWMSSENRTNLSGFQATIRKPDSFVQFSNGVYLWYKWRLYMVQPFENRTHMDHSKTGLVRFSDAYWSSVFRFAPKNVSCTFSDFYRKFCVFKIF